MRGLLDVALDALQFHGLHGGRLALDFFLEPFQQFALLDDHAVELLHLMFQVREVGFESFDAAGIIVCHAGILPAAHREVETAEFIPRVPGGARLSCRKCGAGAESIEIHPDFPPDRKLKKFSLGQPMSK